MKESVERVIDANANRAREGLRVLEDIARFVLDDEQLTARLKACRHEVTTNVEALRPDPGMLTSSRDSSGDVGRRSVIGGENERAEVRGIVGANAHRVEEALRVLEEFSKLNDPGIASRLKDLRYSVYTLEKEILVRVEPREDP